MDFLTLLAQPARAKAFDAARPVSHEVLDQLTWAAQQAPTIDGTRRWHLEVVRTTAGKRRVAESCAERRQLPEAAALLVFCTAGQAPSVAGSDDGSRYAVVDAAAAALATRLAAMALGLAVDWVAVPNAPAVASALDLQPTFAPLVVLAIGYER